MKPIYKVVEIFWSLQGEGFFSGKPTVFIRLAGCNITCKWCDTKFDKYIEMDVDTIVRHVERHYPTLSVCITGGEPTLHDLRPLCCALKDKKYWISIETNGTNPLKPLREFVDWITVSPKTKIDVSNLILASEIKYVVDRFEWIPVVIPPNMIRLIYLQPEGNKKENIEECMRIMKQAPHMRLSLQIHKIINIR